MNLEEATEGNMRFFIPVVDRLTKKNVVFYNPYMELNRDISVAVAKIVKPKHFCDLLSGSGARGIRIAQSIGCKTTANDLNPNAVKLIQKNAELNSTKVNIKNMDANVLLTQERFDFIDIDPFGTPVRFIDSALKSIQNRGILAVTATDTSALCGTYSNACRRKYDSIPLRTDYYNELGLRILLGYIARSALKYDLKIDPLFSHCTRHYFRVYVKVSRLGARTKQMLFNLRYLQHCFKCMYRGFTGLENMKPVCDCGGPLRSAGPLWTAGFADPLFCGELEEQIDKMDLGTKNESMKLVGLVEKEQQVEVPYYNIHDIFKRLKSPALPTDELIKRLQGDGFTVTRTHFAYLGIRTDAGVSDMFRLFK